MIAAWVVALPTQGWALAPDRSLAQPTDPQLLRIEAWAGQLSSPDASTREASVLALTSLPAYALPAIRARLAYLRRDRPSRAWALDVFRQIRRAAGGRGPKDDFDLMPGVLPILAKSQHRRVRRVVEPLLLWRSLERLGTFEATLSMLPLFGMDDGVFWQEGRRVTDRLGQRVLAAAIVARGAGEAYARRWGRRTMRAMGADDPGRLVGTLAEVRLAEVLVAYGMLRLRRAMPIAVSYAGDERRGVRRAARWALSRYGASATWVLRTAYRNRTGRAPSASWGWARVRRALYEIYDAPRRQRIAQALAAAREARSQGDDDAMERHLDELLVRIPVVEPGGRVAEAYVELADAKRKAQKPKAAAEAYRRALRLAPDHDRAARWREGLLDALRAHRRRAGVLEPEAGGGSGGSAAPLALRPRALAGWASVLLLGAVGMAILMRPPAHRRAARQAG